HLRIRQKGVAFVDLEEAGNPQPGGAGEQSAGSLDIEIPRAALGKADVPHGPERNANDYMEMLAVGLDEHLDRDVIRNVVGAPANRQKKDSRGEQELFHVEHPFLSTSARSRRAKPCGDRRARPSKRSGRK